MRLLPRFATGHDSPKIDNGSLTRQTRNWQRFAADGRDSRQRSREVIEIAREFERVFFFFRLRGNLVREREEEKDGKRERKIDR